MLEGFRRWRASAGAGWLIRSGLLVVLSWLTLATAARAEFKVVLSPESRLVLPALEKAVLGKLADLQGVERRLSAVLASPAQSIGSSLFDDLKSGRVALAVLDEGQMPVTEAWFALADPVALVFDVQSARRYAESYRAAATERLSRHGLRLLALAAVESSSLYCRAALTSIKDLKGRKVRAESTLQADLLMGLQAQVQRLPVSEVRSALAARAIDCAFGGTMSGNRQRWHEVTTHLYTLPMGWRLSHYVVHEKTWNALAAEWRNQWQKALRELETRAWESAFLLAREGINCNAGVEPCRDGMRGRMNLVMAADSERAVLSGLWREQILPTWSRRCGQPCGTELASMLTQAGAGQSVR